MTSNPATPTAPGNSLEPHLGRPTPVVGAETLAYLGLDPRRVETHALVLLCERYRLDPLLGHAAIIKTKNGPRPYITRDGMLEVAHRSGALDGIVVDELREGENGWAATVSVYRKDCAHPFTYSAGCGRTEPQAERGNGPEMALARAERRALRRAFAIPTDDRADDDVELVAESPTEGPSLAGPDEIDALATRRAALSDEERTAFDAWKDERDFAWPWSAAAAETIAAKLDEHERTPVGEHEWAEGEEPF